MKIRRKCEDGIKCWIEGALQDVQVRVLFATSDILASKKLVNAVGHAHKLHPCSFCIIDLAGLNEPRGYEPEDGGLKGDISQILQSIFQHQGANDKFKGGSVQKYGFRYSEMMRLVGFDPITSSPLDPMHNSFLGLTMAFVNMLFKYDLLPGTQADRFRDTFEDATYPGHLGRVPARVGKQLRKKPPPTDYEKKKEQEAEGEEKKKKTGNRKIGSGLKADHWKRILQMLPVALFNAWREDGTDSLIDFTDEERSVMDSGDLSSESSSESEDDDDDEEVVESESAPSTSKKGKGRSEGSARRKVIRDRRRWYDVAIGLTAALRILHAHQISYSEACQAVELLSTICKSLLALGAHLTINWHLTMHYAQFVALYGPLSGFGTWAFERHNGVLADTKVNKFHADIPTTLMRSWLAESRLTAVLSNPAPNASRHELNAIKAMLEDKKEVRGTLMMQEARNTVSTFRLCKPIARYASVDLRKEGVYAPVLLYLQKEYPQYDLHDWESHVMTDAPVLPKVSALYTMHSQSQRNGYKFCAPQYFRTRNNQYALVNPDIKTKTGRRLLCRIRMLLSIDGLRYDGVEEPLAADIAVVDVFHQYRASDLPWDARARDCGLRVSNADKYTTFAVGINNLESSCLVLPVTAGSGEGLLVSLSCDTEGPEPEFWLRAEQEQQLIVEWERQLAELEAAIAEAG